MDLHSTPSATVGVRDELLAEVEALQARWRAAGIKPTPKIEQPTRLFLPGLTDIMRAMPNHIARSSLFAPVAPGRKKIYKDKVLVSRSDAIIKFWGEQLDESQADVWMQAMYEARKYPLGERIIFKRAAFLRAIGRHTGNYEYKWLHRALLALSFAMIVIEVRTRDGKLKLGIDPTRALHLIDKFDFEDGTYAIRIDPRWHAMYSNSEFAMVDWNKRLQFGLHQDMAKALQRLVATSSDPEQRNALDWLKSKLEYTGRKTDFEDAISRAMNELVRLEIIRDGRIEVSSKGRTQAVWTKL
ncbi:plasmid stabilization protein [Rhodanobacter sp. DHB23]|uniref:plasmid stabilization protein n=1 Tax=Rhodanobacter sp. DHB23 TaxID=2775923 RepID=UPI00177DCF7C|nr:plasmid stabilization protein [Rhodanobacter sp. DHB23]MBD8872873.1 plasmid stabilization protein [Rhodanobacter sp. DHB23]